MQIADYVYFVRASDIIKKAGLNFIKVTTWFDRGADDFTHYMTSGKMGEFRGYDRISYLDISMFRYGLDADQDG